MSTEVTQMAAAPAAALTAPLEPLAPAAPRKTGPSTVSLAGWSVLGFAAAGYLYVAATNPTLLPDLSQAAVRGDSARAEATAAQAGGEEQTLRAKVERLESEVTRLTANVIASEERAAQLKEQLAQLETPVASRTASAEPPAAIVTPPAQPAARAPAVEAQRSAEAAPSPEAAAIAGKFAEAQLPVKPEPKITTTPVKTVPVTGKVADASTRAEVAAVEAAEHRGTGVKVLNPAKPRSEGRDESVIETGSITPPPARAAAPPSPANPAPAKSAEAPISFGAAVVRPAPRTLGVQIASGTSVEALRQVWGELSILHSDSLKTLQPRYVMGKTASADPTEGERYDLVVGPIRNAAQAKRTCRTLQSRGVACHIADFDGNAL